MSDTDNNPDSTPVDLEDCLLGEFDRWWSDHPTRLGLPDQWKELLRLAFLGGAEAREALVLKGRVMGLTGLEIQN